MPTNLDRVCSFVKKGCCFSVQSFSTETPPWNHKRERARIIVETDAIKARREIVAEYCRYVQVVSNR
jgi:hypothetical protein